jgi:hypothetical protein
VSTFVINNVATVTPLSLARALVGPGVSLSNVKYTGANVAGGSFTDSQKTVGIGSGVILSSGSAKGVAGPNTVSGFALSNNTAGDPDLDAIIRPQVAERPFLPPPPERFEGRRIAPYACQTAQPAQ